MEFRRPVTKRKKKALKDRCYTGWIFMRPSLKWGIVRKRFALFPTRINDATVIWLQCYYSFLVQADVDGGWYWRLQSRALHPMRFRGHTLEVNFPQNQSNVLYLRNFR